MNRILIIITTVVLFAASTFAQPDPVKQTREYRVANERKLLSSFVEMLAMPNVASDTLNINRNADYLIGSMKQRGLNPRLLKAADPKVPRLFTASTLRREPRKR